MERRSVTAALIPPIGEIAPAPPRSAAEPRGDRAVLAAILIAVAALATWNSVHKSLWTDESYTLDTVGHSLAGTLTQTLHFELQPPVYFLALHSWMALGSGIGLARVLSMLAILGCIAICYAIGRVLQLPRTVGLAALVAITPGVIWAAAEARNYPMTLLL